MSTIKSQLAEYFDRKDTPIDSLLYPPILQDIQEVQDISNKVELSPYIEEIDPTSGYAKVGWNLFVMGTNRKFLGFTVHENLEDLTRPTDSKQAMETSLRYATPREVIDFIVDTISKYSDEHVSLGPMKFPSPQAVTSKLPVANTYYEKNKSIGRS